jgi:hypothetical protein
MLQLLRLISTQTIVVKDEEKTVVVIDLLSPIHPSTMAEDAMERIAAAVNIALHTIVADVTITTEVVVATDLLMTAAADTLAHIS